MNNVTKVQWLKLSDLNINADNPNPETISVNKIHTAVKSEGFIVTKGVLTVELKDGVYTVLCGNNRKTWAQRLYDFNPKIYKKTIGKDGLYPCMVVEDLTIAERNGLIYDVSANKVIMPYYCLSEIFASYNASDSNVLRALGARNGFESLLTPANTVIFADLVDRHCQGEVIEGLPALLYKKIGAHMTYARYMFCGSYRMERSLWDTSYPSKDQVTSQHMIKLSKGNAKLLNDAYKKDGCMEGENFNAQWDALDQDTVKVWSNKLMAIKELELVIGSIADERVKAILNLLVLRDEVATSQGQAGDLIQLINASSVKVDPSYDLDTEIEEEDLDDLEMPDNLD
jgi:hypothetical protein